MSPAELAQLHPRLYHLTSTANIASIRAHGLLSTDALLASFGKSGPEHAHLASQRRAKPVLLQNAFGHTATLSDNAPLSTIALAKCLDAGMTPEDWLRQLNRRIFFWPNERRLQKLVLAKNNRNKVKSVLVLDTLAVAEAYASAIELSAINSGATVRSAPRRGAATFTPLAAHSYTAWRSLRGGRDDICEVTLTCPMPDVLTYLIEIRELPVLP